MIVQGNRLIIHSPKRPRQGWDELFVKMAEQDDDRLLDEAAPTRWDEEEWDW